MIIQFKPGYGWNNIPPTRVKRVVNLEILTQVVSGLIESYVDCMADGGDIDFRARLETLYDLLIAIGCTEAECKTALGSWFGWLPDRARAVFETPLMELPQSQSVPQNGKQ